MLVARRQEEIFRQAWQIWWARTCPSNKRLRLILLRDGKNKCPRLMLLCKGQK